jgi:nitroreductase
MDALECIATRRSIRSFLDIAVDQETILTIVEAGTYAPSAGNLQDWRFVVVEDKTLLKSLSEYCLGQASIQNSSFSVVVCSDYEQTERNYGLRGERLYTIQNCAAAIQNMLLAAHSLGLGGVWIGAFDENKIRVLLGIPNNVRPQAILAFGYPSEPPGTKIMRDLAVITYFNKYGTKVKNMHRFLKDYHVEWENRINAAHTALDRVKKKIEETSKDVSKEAKIKSGTFFGKMKNTISEKMKPKDK